MANTVCTSFKSELLSGVHDFATAGDTFKLSLYTSSSTINNASTTVYTTSDEVANSGSYTAGGGSLANQAVSTDGTTAIVDFDDLSFTSATITARYALIYNSSDSNKAVCVLDFGTDQTSTSGTFTIQFPSAGASTAIIRVA
tara:strand:- start:8 stop:433 length:426 start_codon:yes stop_codon:yes gene_type:complete